MNTENRIKAALDILEASEELKAATRSFLQEARRGEEMKRGQRRRASRLSMAAYAVCAAVLTLAIGIGGYALLLVPVSYVSIDVNPSIELELNRIDRVISAKAYNEDGERILEGVSVGGKYYTDAIDLLMESSQMQPYLTEDAALTFTVASDSSQREDSLLNGVRNSSGCQNHGGTSVRTELAMVTEAHECGLSLGKYSAYKILLEYDGSISLEDCHRMTMSEIHGLLEEHGHKGNGGRGEHQGAEDASHVSEHQGAEDASHVSEHQDTEDAGHVSEHQGTEDASHVSEHQGAEDASHVSEHQGTEDASSAVPSAVGNDCEDDAYEDTGRGSGHGSGHGHNR